MRAIIGSEPSSAFGAPLNAGVRGRMTTHQVVALAVRLFAVWLALEGVPYFVYAPSQLASAALIAGYLTGGAYLVAALILWVFPLLIARRLLPESTRGIKLSPSAVELTRTAVVVSGIFLLTWNLPYLSMDVVRLATA